MWACNGQGLRSTVLNKIRDWHMVICLFCIPSIIMYCSIGHKPNPRGSCNFIGNRNMCLWITLFFCSFIKYARCLWENYIILREYIKCVLPPLTEVVGLTMNLINGTYHFCERREYAFNVLLEYDIIICACVSGVQILYLCELNPSFWPLKNGRMIYHLTLHGHGHW